MTLSKSSGLARRFIRNSARSDVVQHKSYTARITNSNAKAGQAVYFDDALEDSAAEEPVEGLDSTARALSSTITQTFPS